MYFWIKINYVCFKWFFSPWSAIFSGNFRRIPKSFWISVTFLNSNTCFAKTNQLRFKKNTCFYLGLNHGIFWWSIQQVRKVILNMKNNCNKSLIENCAFISANSSTQSYFISFVKFFTLYYLVIYKSRTCCSINTFFLSNQVQSEGQYVNFPIQN